MARLRYVKKARKDQGACSKCRKPIKAGDAYKWWANRIGRMSMKRKVCASCKVTRADTTLSKLGPLYAAQDEAEEALQQAFTGDDIAAAIETVREVAEEVRDEYQEGLDNMPDGLREAAEDGMVGERIQELEQYMDELDSKAGELTGEEWEEETAAEGEEPARDADGKTLDEWLEEKQQEALDAIQSLEC